MIRSFKGFCILTIFIFCVILSPFNFTSKIGETNGITLISRRENLQPTATFTDYLSTADGTDFYVTVETVQLYIQNIEYSVKVTIGVISFGVDVDRIYNIQVDLILDWTADDWNSAPKSIAEVNTEGGSAFTIFGVAMNEGDFGSLSNNEEVPMTLYYHLVLTEGIIFWPDSTSEGTLEVCSITYRNTPPVAVSGIYDVELPAIYSDYETKMGLSVRTNALWKTGEYYTILVSFTAVEFPDNIDRFHHIEFCIHFKYGIYDYVTSITDDLEVALGESLTHDYHINIGSSLFGGLALGQQITVGLWYDLYYKEGVILAIDPEYNLESRYIYDIVIKNEAGASPTDTKMTHTLDLDTSMVLTHMAAKSLIFNGEKYLVEFHFILCI